jgi:hypothetical protein
VSNSGVGWDGGEVGEVGWREGGWGIIWLFGEFAVKKMGFDMNTGVIIWGGIGD